ncbi:glycosyltransferase family 2 protein [Allopontixanthobacter sediminis]
MTISPRVSVVMAVYNGARFLREAVDSILDQTLTDFEFLIVDDASTDETPVILKQLAKRDDRIVLIRNERNLGPYPSANRALDRARGEYIARLDADDIALSDRLDRQVCYLDENPEVFVVGGIEIAINSDGVSGRSGRSGLNPLPFRYLAHFTAPIVHSSATFQRISADHEPLRYSQDRLTAQDFRMYQQLLDHGEGYRLPVPVVKLREHDANISKTHRSQQAETAVTISTEALRRTCPQESEANLRALASFVIDGDLTGGMRPSEVIHTILAVEQAFETLHKPSDHDRAIIRGLTVNQILKGVAKMRHRSLIGAVGIATRLARRRPMSTSREVLAILSRRRA